MHFRTDFVNTASHLQNSLTRILQRLVKAESGTGEAYLDVLQKGTVVSQNYFFHVDKVLYLIFVITQGVSRFFDSVRELEAFSVPRQ